MGGCQGKGRADDARPCASSPSKSFWRGLRAARPARRQWLQWVLGRPKLRQRRRRLRLGSAASWAGASACAGASARRGCRIRRAIPRPPELKLPLHFLHDLRMRQALRLEPLHERPELLHCGAKARFADPRSIGCRGPGRFRERHCHHSPAPEAWQQRRPVCTPASEVVAKTSWRAKKSRGRNRDRSPSETFPAPAGTPGWAEGPACGLRPTRQADPERSEREGVEGMVARTALRSVWLDQWGRIFRDGEFDDSARSPLSANVHEPTGQCANVCTNASTQKKKG